MRPAVGAVEMWKSGRLLPDFQARWKEWKTRLGFLSFPRFPRGVISTALFLSSSLERSDAGYCSLPRFFAHRFTLHLDSSDTIRHGHWRRWSGRGPFGTGETAQRT